MWWKELVVTAALGVQTVLYSSSLLEGTCRNGGAGVHYGFACLLYWLGTVVMAALGVPVVSAFGLWLVFLVALLLCSVVTALPLLWCMVALSFSLSFGAVPLALVSGSPSPFMCPSEHM